MSPGGGQLITGVARPTDTSSRPEEAGWLASPLYAAVTATGAVVAWAKVTSRVACPAVTGRASQPVTEPSAAVNATVPVGAAPDPLTSAVSTAGCPTTGSAGATVRVVADVPLWPQSRASDRPSTGGGI